MKLNMKWLFCPLCHFPIHKCDEGTEEKTDSVS